MRFGEGFHENKITFVDGVQYAPHYQVDVSSIGCDFFACSPYKFFGPHLGTIWGRREVLEKCHSYKTRTVSNELPQRFFVGIHPFELLSGLLGTIEYFETLGRLGAATGKNESSISNAFALVEMHENRLAGHLLDTLNDIADLQLIGPNQAPGNNSRAPIFSFVHRENKLESLAKTLASHGIFFHWGRKFANQAADFLNIDANQGFLRVGVSHYNTESEIERFGKCLRQAMNA